MSDIFLSLVVVQPLRIVDRAALRGGPEAIEAKVFIVAGFTANEVLDEIEN